MLKPKRHRRTNAQIHDDNKRAELQAIYDAIKPVALENAANATPGQRWRSNKIINRVGRFDFGPKPKNLPKPAPGEIRIIIEPTP